MLKKHKQAVVCEEMVRRFSVPPADTKQQGLECVLPSAAVAFWPTGCPEQDLNPSKHLNPSKSEMAKAGDIPPPPAPSSPFSYSFCSSFLTLNCTSERFASKSHIGSAVLRVQRPPCFLQQPLHLS
ncbi:hypothetical protein Baya_14410 [Bagarius yarrelli]|uniref:Uncharacterized protein n=1 Tax=Bagarius yarrelli TaxID=175774 RepID=A0A556V8V9_BAGYA|nr:hypothetical protein Baya_14410 [Bagarius yarrelli]